MSTRSKEAARAAKAAKPPARSARLPQEARLALREYEAKRDFAVTPEPVSLATPRAQDALSFVVHKHDATRLHYDLRLEIEGALASWSVPKGPSYDPAVRRLAVQTEDHPLEYGAFEGRIPDGEYGAGDSLLWDRGTWDTVPPGQGSAMRRKGHLHFRLVGEKLRGEWHLIRTTGPRGERHAMGEEAAQGTKSQWLLFKAKDGKEDPRYDVVEARPESVLSGRVATRGPERKGELRAPRPSPSTLLEDALPPMLATLVSSPPPDEAAWLAEAKIDGYRALCALSSGRVAMITRNGLDLTARFPAVARGLSRVVVGDAILDGEIAALDAHGVPRFELLQQGAGEAVFYAFDLVRLDGKDLRSRPLSERRDLLRSLLSNAPPPLRVTEELPAPFGEALAQAEAHGLEGLVLKLRDSRYENGRSRSWLKLKAQKAQELAVVGYLPGEGGAAGGVGALLLAVAESGGLRFAGKVGTGFSAKQRRELKDELDRDRVDAPRAAEAPRMRGGVWVEPRLVAQVRFTAWTADGKLRHPAFQGLRTDKAPLECVREKAAPPPRGPEAGTPGSEAKSARRATPTRPAAAAAPAAESVALTHPERVLYPRDGIAKQDLADYSARVAGPLLRALSGRPLVLVHWNEGIDRPSWFHQDMGAGERGRAEPWMHLVATPTLGRGGKAGKLVRHLVADSPAALRWLAQRSALELHCWHSREGSLGSPDWVVFDLDPAEGRDIEQAIPVAQVLQGMFEHLGLPSVPKTTGKRGLHVLVPLALGHTYDDAQSFALRVAQTVVQQIPEVTLERGRARRGGRLYLDCLQNAQGKTIIAPYSPRGVDGAPVSAPLRWSEVRPGLDPRAFNLRTMPARLEQVGDLFAPALERGVRLPRFR
jgi:bifunctional non-homologous end joining protein LigD